jgi:hypothetical protein
MWYLALIFGTGAAAGAGAGIGVVVLIAYIRSRNTPRELHQTNFLFSGNLKQTSVLDAIQFLEIQKREGILHIYCGRRKGYITFVKGKVIDAFYRNTVGREAMFAMLDLQEGDFYFEPKVIDQPQLISDSIMDIVMTWDAQKNQG